MRILHGFLGPPTDAGNSQASLLNDGDGNLYGTATPGGASSEWGTFFPVKR